MPTKEQIKNGFAGGDEGIAGSAMMPKDKVLLFNGKEIKAGDTWTEKQANIIADSLKRSREALNNLIEEMIEVKNSKGNEDQVLTSLLTTLSEQLIRIDKIGVDLQPEAALETIEEAVKDLIKEELGLTVNLSLRSEILHITIPALESTIKTLRESQGSGSAIEASKKTEGPAIISAVKSLQDKLPDDVNEQVLKFIANVNPNGELEYPIKKDDPVMIGHVRGDRAGYLALGLQTSGFENLLGYIKFNKNFKGVSMLSEEAVGKINNTFFERLSGQGYTSARISEDEKKEHVGYNADGRNDQPLPGERRVVIPMQKSSKAYVDTPAMKMKEVTDAVLTELDGKVDFILTNFLSSDMMKHTGNFDAAKKSNEITDRQLGRIKEKIDAIKAETIKKLKSKIIDYIRVPEYMLSLSVLLDRDYDEFSKIVSSHKDSSPPNKLFYQEIKLLEQQVPLFIITADHGASEEGLKENPKESNNFHTANPVPYIIYDPLRRQKIPLKGGKTIRNNAATLLQLLGEEIPKEYDESLLPADYQGSKRRIAFAVLDGWGINPDQSYPYDAIRLADTPNYDWFVENASFTTLWAHGEVIGLRKILSYEEGPHHLRGLQAGQTDIGHIHLFSGREVKQPLWYIDQLIKGGLANGVFDETKEEVKALIRELKKVKETGQKFHYLTIGSEGGVHASLYHMYALMRLAKKVGLEKDQFVIHFGADGRDVPTRTAHLYLQDVYKKIEQIGIGVVSVVFGRDMLVRKEGAENITNRLIDVLSGENLKGDDVTLSQEASTGSPLTAKEQSARNFTSTILKKIKEVYDRIAPEYSDIWGDDVQKEVVEHRKAFLEIVPKNAVVVDAGTGPGRDAAWFNDNGLQAIGIDFSSKMIAEARKRHPSFQFKQMDLRYLEIYSNTIDGIWDNAAFHHLPPDAAKQTLNEYYRVMKSGGTLFLRVKQGDGDILQPDKKYPDETRYFKLYQKDELENLAASQGFEIIESGIEIDSKKAEQAWVYLFAKKHASAGSPREPEPFPTSSPLHNTSLPKVKVAINGFGRIGKIVLKAFLENADNRFEIVAVNDLDTIGNLAHLFRHDSTFREFKGEVRVEGDNLIINGHRIKVLSERDPAQLPWKDLGIEIVIESTGRFTKREDADKHLKAGAKRVVITAPGEKADLTVVLGVNEEKYDPQAHEIISNASCTTNCLAPVVKILHEKFGIKYGQMLTVHAATNDQIVLDGMHKDLRRARATIDNIIPTTTGAAKAVGEVLPELKGKLDGFAMRVPTKDVSVVYLVADLLKDTTVEEVNAALKQASEEGRLSKYLGYTAEQLVSSDFLGNSKSSTIDASLTKVVGGRQVAVVAFYDNEWGYSNRVVDLVNYMIERTASTTASLSVESKPEPPTSSPLTVEILKKIEWKYIVLDSLEKIFKERFEKQEYHGKLFVIDNFWKRFSEERSDNQKIQAIRDAMAVSMPKTVESSKIKEANKNELSELIFGGLRSYYQKISQEIKTYLSAVDVSENADLKNKRKSILAEIKDIEDYSHKKEGHSDYFRDKKIVFQLNMAARVYKMMQDKMPLSDILKQSLPGVSSALTGNEALGEYINIINDYATVFEALLNQYFNQSRGPNVDLISRKIMEEAQAKFIAEVSWLKKVPETGMLLDVCLKNILERKPVLSKQGMWISVYENFMKDTQPENTNVLKLLEKWRPLLKDMDNKIEGLVKKIQASSSIMDGQETPAKVLGGIDFRQMNMLIQPQGSFASSSLDFSLPSLSKAEIESFDLDKELSAIQKMASSGIAPSDERLKEYLAVCFAKERTGSEIDNLKLCLLDVFEQQQLEAKETPNGYKEVLVIADTRGYVLKEGRLAASKHDIVSLN